MPASEKTHPEIVRLLTLIAEHRGQCATCGADCDGPGEGMTPDPCPLGHTARNGGCAWKPGDQAARAKEALRHARDQTTRERVQGAVREALRATSGRGEAAQADAAIVATLQTLADDAREAGARAILDADVLLAICGDVRR